MKHVVQFSAGLSSLETAFRVAAKHGTDDLTLVFADTLYEHPTTYRLLVTGGAKVFGLDATHLGELAMKLPSITEDQMEVRRVALAELRFATALAVPGLVWLVDGRTPHEVFRDARFLGNSSVPRCSIDLKRKVCDRWLEENRHPVITTLYFGFGFREPGRIANIHNTKRGWHIKCPMDDAPLMDRVQLMQACRDRGLHVPDLYLMGFPHGNCHGLCCQAGQAVWEKSYRYFPDEYGMWEREEERFRQDIAPGVSSLTDRRGGTKKPLTLTQFRERITSGDQSAIDWEDRGACSCFTEEEESCASPRLASDTGPPEG